MLTALVTRLPRPGSSALLPAAILAVILLMVVPVPAFLLDVMFVGNILLSLVMLMVVLHATRPLDFSAFPTVLLFATLLRLALNVASTRVVLVAGHEGTDAAGQVIEAFGKALIAGNYIVGIIVFVILMIINLAVIAKGAGRVSEVSARFTLDALPGKQMAIDADLNAGLLTPDEARARRREVATEADFYGSMDGASKFVKGDALAGILILLINIIGGLAIGMASHGLGFGAAADIYFLLAIGDALVAQVPALLLSIAAAILVTRSSDAERLGSQLGTQFASPGAWWPASAILGLLALIPAMPTPILLAASASAGLVAWRLGKALPPPVSEPSPPALPDGAISWQEVGEAARINLDIGYGLIGLVDDAAGAPLMARITGIRRQISRELGFVLPMARVRDDLSLAPHSYRITIAGELAGTGECFPLDLLALEAEAITADIPGRPTRDPAFGLKARWIAPEQEQAAIAAGFTVVDPSTVIGTHLHKLLKSSANTLFGQDEAHALIEALSERQPQLGASIDPKAVPLPLTTAVCQALLEEGVPLRDFARIAAAIAATIAQNPQGADAPAIVERVREMVGGLIVAAFAGPDQALKLIALSPPLETLLVQAHRTAPTAHYPFEPDLAARLADAVRQTATPLLEAGEPVALVVPPGPRRALWRLIRSSALSLPVLAFTELPDNRAVEVVAVLGDDSLKTERDA